MMAFSAAADRDGLKERDRFWIPAYRQAGL
jgi:hypothetical protein